MKDESDLEHKTRCLHQIFRPESQIYVTTNGRGDCSKCTYDPDNNPKCKGYYPISISYIDIKN